MTATQRRKRFTEWMHNKKKEDGNAYSKATIDSYATSIATSPKRLTGIELSTTNIYEIELFSEFELLKEKMRQADNYEEVNRNAGNRAFHYGLEKYGEFLMELEGMVENPDSIGKHSVDKVEQNVILYGPPGTGKTYYTAAYAVAMIEGKSISQIEQEIEAEGYAVIRERFKSYKARNQVEFTTFHQSYGYEEFMEGIKPVMNADNLMETEDTLSYEIKPGIFKQFCERAQEPIVQEHNVDKIRKNPTVWKVSLSGQGLNLKRDCFENDRIRIGWDDYGDIPAEDTDYSARGGRQIIDRFINEMKIGDLVLVLHDERTIDAIGVITSDYKWLGEEVSSYKRSRQVKWLVKDILEDIFEMNGNTVLTSGSVYRLNRITLTDVESILAKHDYQTATSMEKNEKNYVFIIDEINRGNISKIFGELITLIESTKRLGEQEEITLQLPYSEKPFGIPKNVYILATMNTADRSIARIDTALRRRFQFIEMLPDPNLLEAIQLENINFPKMLQIINTRIETLFDRDHTIGHAYFIPLIQNHVHIGDLAAIFKNAIIPLLQEYFYEDYEMIRLVLGDNQKNREDQFIQEKNHNEVALFGMSITDGMDERKLYHINDKAFTNASAYRKIYENVGE